ncbi:TerD family protein [Streptomyces sp. NBC_00536]|uniref:TerD family protein n=1 Tax=Streptomyces sp. NBC_00536 TaxID=2975769 RepID=UPI002E811A99|nr:TerD family protein [Streptomyces sp. NBC_00536]WUC77645.1 TerD family protein [Streptomyces sp. NBC_00536]
MSGVRKSLARVEVALKWDPSAPGSPANDLDIIAAVYAEGDVRGTPEYVVYFDHRAPDGTITLNRDSRTGQGFGFDEVMTLELDRMSERLRRVVVGVVVQSDDGTRTFGDIGGMALRIREGYTDLVAEGPVAGVAGVAAATVAVFTRDAAGAWSLDPAVHGVDAGPEEYLRIMGDTPAAGPS